MNRTTDANKLGVMVHPCNLSTVLILPSLTNPESDTPWMTFCSFQNASGSLCLALVGSDPATVKGCVGQGGTRPGEEHGSRAAHSSGSAFEVYSGASKSYCVILCSLSLSRPFRATFKLLLCPVL